MNSRVRTVLVTGASRGLGLEIVRELLSAGFSVVGVARSQSVELQVTMQSCPDRMFFEPFDLSDTSEIQSFASTLHRRYGRFYGLVNNAAIGGEGILATMHEHDICEVVGTNLIAPILLCKYLSRGMLLSRAGRIVNIASVVAQSGASGLSVYAASKAGLIGLTKSLARELGKAGITVSSVSPGYLETSMSATLDESKLAALRRRSPSGRFVTVAEVARTVKFLLSDAGSGINGTNIVVDLGSTA
jgi:3-oxoacyl-[acyl-carrier protein] reductase